MTLNVDHDLSEVNSDIWHCAKFHENRTFTFREITTSVTNEIRSIELTNQQTNSPAHNTSYREIHEGVFMKRSRSRLLGLTKLRPKICQSLPKDEIAEMDTH